MSRKDKDKHEKAVSKPEAVYSREELIAGAAAFGVKPEVVAGALRLAGKDAMTKAEAEQAIKAFLNREV